MVPTDVAATDLTVHAHKLLLYGVVGTHPGDAALIAIGPCLIQSLAMDGRWWGHTRMYQDGVILWVFHPEYV